MAERALALWGDTVYRVALGQTGSRLEAEDIYQDVFLKLLERPCVFESDEHLKAWLIRVTINQSRDRLRFRARHATDSLEDHDEEAERKLAQAATNFDGAGDQDHLSDLWEVVALLPEDQRTVVNLFYVEELSTRDIARILDCTAGAVRTRLYRARETLRDLLCNGEGSRNTARDTYPIRGATQDRNATSPRPNLEKEAQL